ncbi:MAG: ABC transporter ATP-binding protein [Bacteroidales bacterium]|nr:ABC transporter ATP-binding protein [Bacteroidales bacterium]
MNLLEIKNLTIQFKSQEQTLKAVDDISFVLGSGETLAIVGESGSGKSVTCLSVLKLINEQNCQNVSGEIIYYEKDKASVNLLKLNDKELQSYRGKKIAMIFQEPMTSLNPVFTCGEQLRESLHKHQKLSKKQIKAKIISLFNEVKLPKPERIYKSYPHELSGGQRQRVMIAMAVSCEPDILIADEPTTALDVTVQKSILQLLKNLQSQYKMSIIFITHDLNLVFGFADRVLVMYKGKIVEQGTVKDIVSHPKHPYTKGLLACRPSLKTTKRILPTISDFMEIDEKGNIIEKNTVITDDISERKAKKSPVYSKEPILRIINIKNYFPIFGGFLNKTKDYVKALDNVSLDVYPGETLGLVGESGCGKTTLGRTILRLIKPDEGKIIFNNTDIAKLSDKQLRKLRKDMQIIFQDPYSSLNPHISIGKAITEPMKIHNIFSNEKDRKYRAMEILEKVGLNTTHFNKYPYEFSGGQRQRICIARALALNPKFIVCDESVSALDVSIQAQVLNLLNRLKEEFNFTNIFISHDLSVVKYISDRIVIMQNGRIVESGFTNNIYQNPQSEYTKTLLAAIPSFQE